MAENKKYFHNLDVERNKVMNLRLNPLTTVQRTAIGGTLGVGDQSYVCYDTTLNQQYFWDGTQWIVVGGSSTIPSLQDVVNVGNGISNFGGIGYANIQSTNFTNGRTLYLNDNSYATIRIVDNANASNYLQIDLDTLNIDGTSYNWSSIVNQGTVTSVTATSPLFSSGGITPNITIQQASGSQDGYLSSGDWTTFNTKEPAIAAGTTSQYWRGDKTWQTFPTIPTVGTWGALNYPTWTTGTPFVKMTAVGTFALDTTSYQPLLTNPVTGTGTTNYVPKWSSSSALTDSQIFDNGTSVGIGTASPNALYKLDVNGVIKGSSIYFQNGIQTGIEGGANKYNFWAGNNKIATWGLASVGATLFDHFMGWVYDGTATGTSTAFRISSPLVSTGANTAGLNQLLIDPQYSQQTFGAGTLRGVYYNPSGSVNTSTHIAWENTQGDIIHGNLATGGADEMVTVDTSGKLKKQTIPSGGGGTVTSVDLTMPSAFTVTGNPVTTSGTLAVTGTGSTSQLIDGTGALQTIPTSLPPSGTAGGDLNGTYPNPTVDGLQGNAVANIAPTSGQVLQWSSGASAWIPGAIPTGGSGGGGVFYYFNYQNTTGISPTTGLPTSPVAPSQLGINYSIGAGSINSANLTNGTYTLVCGFVTIVGTPGVTDIPAGLWDFNIWADIVGANGSANQTQFQIRVYKYNSTTGVYTSLANSDDIYVYDPTVIAQYIGNVTMPQTTILATDRIYIEFWAQKNVNQSRQISFHFDSLHPSHVHTTIPSVSGTGLVKAVNGVFQSPASTLVDADVSATAAIAATKIANGLVSNTEFQFLDGVTSSIQTQIGNKVDKSQGAYTMLANNTNGTADMTAQAFQDPGSQTYTGTITWGTPATQPLGATNHSYRWTRIGKMVTLNISLVYATASTGVQSNVTTTLPTDCPTPFKPPGLTAASSYMYPAFCNGGVLTSTSSTQTYRGGLRNNAANNGYEIIMSFTGTNIIYYNVTVTYWTS